MGGSSPVRGSEGLADEGPLPPRPLRSGSGFGGLFPTRNTARDSRCVEERNLHHRRIPAAGGEGVVPGSPGCRRKGRVDREPFELSPPLPLSPPVPRVLLVETLLRPDPGSRGGAET